MNFGLESSSYGFASTSKARLFRVFGFDHTAIVVAFVREGRVYEISYTGSTSADPDLAEHVSIYEHMKQSFQLVPAIETEVFDLGGPCDDGAGSFSSPNVIGSGVFGPRQEILW